MRKGSYVLYYRLMCYLFSYLVIRDCKTIAYIASIIKIKVYYIAIGHVSFNLLIQNVASYYLPIIDEL